MRRAISSKPKNTGIRGCHFSLWQGLKQGSTPKGFTLLEVLVATAILGTAIAALMGLLASSLGNLRRLQAPEQARLLAQGQLNDLLIRAERGQAFPVFPLDQKIQGRWDEQFRWEAQASRLHPSAQTTPGETILVRIVLEAYWKTRVNEGEHKLLLETVQLWRNPETWAQ